MPRHLPVLKVQEEAPPRTVKQWILLGAGLMVVVWIPLAVLANAATRYALPPSSEGQVTAASWLWVAGPAVLAFSLACSIGGHVLTRLGRVEPWVARNAGVAFSALAWAIAFIGSGGARMSTIEKLTFIASFGVLVGLGAPFAWLGARLTR